MQFEGQRPKHEWQSREAMVGGSGGMPSPGKFLKRMD